MKELQNTELLLTQIIYTINLKKGEINNQEMVEKIYSKCLGDYLSQLVKKVKDLSPESEKLLIQDDFLNAEKIIKLRNHFAHNFFKEFSSSDNEQIMDEIVQGNKFAFNHIKKFNKQIQARLRSYLTSMTYNKSEIEGIVQINSENWDSIITN